MDSLSNTQSSFIADFDHPAATIANEEVPLIEGDMNLGALDSAIILQPYIEMAAGEKKVLTRWGYDLNGRVRVQAGTHMNNHILIDKYWTKDEGYYNTTGVEGGFNLEKLALANSYTLVANDWHLTDGAEAIAAFGRAGRHESVKSPGEDSGLYRQVNRMTFLGDQGGSKYPWWAPTLLIINPLLRPSTDGTFVVSHAYWNQLDDPEKNGTRDCEAAGNRTSYSGMTNQYYEKNNLADPTSYPGIDGVMTKKGKPFMRCFDTAPFRDSYEYDNLEGSHGSEYAVIFSHRGKYFMGCKNAQAEDTSHASDTSFTDQHTSKVDCE